MVILYFNKRHHRLALYYCMSGSDLSTYCRSVWHSEKVSSRIQTSALSLFRLRDTGTPQSLWDPSHVSHLLLKVTQGWSLFRPCADVLLWICAGQLTSHISPFRAAIFTENIKLYFTLLMDDQSSKTSLGHFSFVLLIRHHNHPVIVSE